MPAAPAAPTAIAPPGATARDGINAKHKGGPDGYALAMAIFQANLATNPKNALALYGKGWIEAEQQKKQEAMQTFGTFLAVSKDRAKNKEASAAVSRLKASPMASAPAPAAPARAAGPAPAGPGGPGGPGRAPGGPGMP